MFFVIKVSKLCNLRCSYCYEFPELGNRDRMSRQQLTAMYEHIRDYLTATGDGGAPPEAAFVWHGGEPLLVDPSFYWDTFQDQREVFGDAVARSNSVQTNLTRLDDERLRLLSDGFDNVGVSLDVYGGLRVNIAGRNSQETVLANMDRLRAAGVPFGCITVLNQRNVHRVDDIFSFYDRAGLEFRVLPLFDGASQEQTAPLALSLEEELGALCRLADLWLESGTMSQPPLPLDQYVNTAARATAGAPHRDYYSRQDQPWVVLVNTNGDCYTQGEPYGDPAWSIGNLFTEPLTDILSGERFARCVAEAERRQAVNCLPCPFFGHCDGLPIAEADHRERDVVADGVQLCTARPVIEHIARRMRTAQPEPVARPADPTA
jgi:uncharacterized protein